MTNRISGAASAGVPIPAEWLGWIAENLLTGVPAATLVGLLTENSFDPATASAAVTAAANHPFLRGATAALESTKRAVRAEAGSGTRAAKYAWWLEVMRRSARLAPDWGQVPRIERPPTADFLHDYYATNRPCVIEGAMEDWPALTKWTREHLVAQFGDETAEVEVFIDPDDPTAGRQLEEMPFRDFVDIIEGDDASRVNGHYMTANNTEKNEATFASLWDDIVWPDFLEPNGHPLGNGFLWYGPRDSFTPLHHDLSNNLMAQFRGRKLVKLVAPVESAHIYNHEHRYSHVDLDDIDLERFPEMADVTVFETVIGPGDMLFIPAGWWHTVRALDVSITITFANFIWESDHWSHYTTYDEID